MLLSASEYAFLGLQFGRPAHTPLGPACREFPMGLELFCKGSEIHRPLFCGWFTVVLWSFMHWLVEILNEGPILGDHIGSTLWTEISRVIGSCYASSMVKPSSRWRFLSPQGAAV